jgi:Family of unknown function (DUF5675)
MNLLVTRKHSTPHSVCGELSINGTFFCYTLEPPKRAEKPHCIPAGTYDVTLRLSSRFGRIMPHVENVPGFEGILIHWGNYPRDTEGCLLVGEKYGEVQDFIGESQVAFHALFSKLHDALEAGEQVYITYQEQV